MYEGEKNRQINSPFSWMLRDQSWDYEIIWQTVTTNSEPRRQERRVCIKEAVR